MMRQMDSSSDPRFPIGRFSFKPNPSIEDRRGYILQIASVPNALRDAVRGMTDSMLDTRYREEGWTVRQVVHHLFDSHANAYIRFRLALTEDHPRVTAYDEKAWADLADTQSVPVDVSLGLLDGLHARWVATLNAMQDSDFGRNIDHPDNGIMSVDELLQMYAWHGDHHIAHVTSLKQRMGW
ncbi:MAG: putative metal-dependent hydrolase [Bacteroidetes bacterium]|nr:putative metal-dependent hydrolase [Bacteroidota bacterium]MDA1333927.1 putative metal-dependent hydrolase [Bacteroidota bacterium]